MAERIPAGPQRAAADGSGHEPVGALAQLALRTQRGDRKAADALCRKLAGPVLRYCLARMGSRSEAEDVCQEALATVIAGLDRLERPQAVLGYTLGIARNLARRQLSRGPRVREVPFDEASHGAPCVESAGAPGQADARDLQERREDALVGLLATEPRPVRQLVELYYRQGRSSAQIAAALGIQPSGVRMRLQRIRARLRARLLALALEERQ